MRTPAAQAERAKRADARRNYERLLSAAAGAFAEHGADDVSLEEIARRAGVGIGTLYRHFPSRSDLVAAVFRDQVGALQAQADDLLSSPEPVEALTTWLRAVMAFTRTKHSMTSALLADAKGAEVMTACRTVLQESATALLERAQRAGTVRADASAQDVLWLAHAVSMAADRAPADTGQADRLLGLIVDGLRSPSAPRISAGDLGRREQ